MLLSGYSPLHLAVYRTWDRGLKMLGQSPKVNINLRDNDGRTPLWLAAYLGRKATVENVLSISNIETSAPDYVREQQCSQFVLELAHVGTYKCQNLHMPELAHARTCT